jgi:hypothetical protein
MYVCCCVVTNLLVVAELLFEGEIINSLAMTTFAKGSISAMLVHQVVFQIAE